MRSRAISAALTFLVTSVASAQIGTNISGLTILNPPGPPLEVDTISVGAYTVARANLTAGSIVGKDNSGNFQGTWAAPYTAANPASDLNLTTYLAKNDLDTGGPAAALPFDVFFGGQVGVTSTWKDHNGASNPDFFLYDAVVDATIGIGGDAVDVAPILPGGVIGQRSFFFNSGFWGDSGINVTGGPNNGQSLLGVAFSVTDLLDQNGAPLTTTSQIQGLRIFSNTLDTALIAAEVAAPAQPLQLQVNATTGAVSIHNPNATEYTLGFNFYRIGSTSNSLVYTNWNSLDDQEGADLPGQNWEEGGGSSGTGGGSLAGDYNANGMVDAADYTRWRDGLGTTFTQAQYDTWKNNFGATGPPPGATNQLLELNLDGLKSLAPNASVSLGNVFAIGGTNDLTFTYGVAAGQMATGTVSVAGAALAASTTVPEPAAWISATTIVLTVGLGCAVRRRK